MNKLLLLILFVLMALISGKQGIKLFFSLILNFLILMLTFILISIGFNPIIVSLLGCIIISTIILYFVNGKNIKTKSSFISVILVLMILVVLIFVITKLSRTAGFGYESFEDINMFSYDIKLDFTKVEIGLILIGLIGATIDSSIAISSALYEVYLNNKDLSMHELFLSGLKIGRDIIGTTTNTLFFAFLGEFMTLLFFFKTGSYPFSEIINNKTFCKELIKILFSAIGCTLIIPITALITSYKITHQSKKILD